VPCLTYNTSHPLVQKQLLGETLTNNETASLIEVPFGHRFYECEPAPGTEIIRHKQANKCLEKDKLYTVCYDVSGFNKPGSWRCGIFAAGARATRVNGEIDCMGGCNEGQRSCYLHRHRGSCFTHDVCSVVQDATGFIFHPECGNEANHAMWTGGQCHSHERW